MSKIVLDTITSGYNLSTINNNFVLLQNELNNSVLYRVNPVGEPNSLSNDIDMNSNDLLNAGRVEAAAMKIGGVSVVPSGTFSADAVNISYTPEGSVVAIDVQKGLEKLRPVDSLAELRTVPLVAGNMISSNYRTTLGDGGGGDWYAAFVADIPDLVARVAADTLSGIYAAPDSDPTGASGAWVRRLNGFVTPQMFGAAGDLISDDSAALLAADVSGHQVTIYSGHSVQANTTLSGDYTFITGGSIKPSPAVTVTSTGSISAPDVVIFDGSAGGLFDFTPNATTARISWFSGQYLNDKWDNFRTWWCAVGTPGNNWACTLNPPTSTDGDAYEVVGGENKWVIDGAVNLDFDCSEGTLYVEAPITNVTGSSNFDGFVIGNDAANEKIVNLNIHGELRVQHRDETDFLNKAIWIASGSRITTDGLVGRGKEGVVIGGANQAQNMGPVSIPYIFVTGHTVHGVEISAGGTYSVQEVNIDNITTSDPFSVRTTLSYGVKFGAGLREIDVDSILVTFSGAGGVEPKGGVTVEASNQTTQFGGNINGLRVGRIMMDVCNGPVLNVGRSVAGAVINAVVGDLYSSGIGTDGAADEEHVIIDYSDRLTIDKVGLLNARTDISIGANSGRVEISGIDNNGPTITNAGPKTFINGMGFTAGVAATPPSSALFQVGDQVCNTADNSIWQKVQHTGTPANDYKQLA